MAGGNMELSKKELEYLIINFMKTQGMCVLATCSENAPRASAVEFFPIGTTIYVLTEGGRKVDNIAVNKNVSVAIHTPFTGWDSIKGVQITGTAEAGKSGSRIFEEGEEAYKMRRRLKSVYIPGCMSFIKVTPQKIEYLDTTLKARKLGIRHVLTY
jgi:general stress protein 26